MMRFSKFFASSKGFTLIEILLGFFLFSVIAALLYNSFFTGVQLSIRSQNRDVASREGYLAISQLVQDLENIVPFDFSGLNPKQQSFVGESQHLLFLRHTDEGLRVVEYYSGRLKKGTGRLLKANDWGLYRREMSFAEFLRDEPPTTSIEESIVLRHLAVEGLKFAYVGANAKDFAWQDQWIESGIPAGIKVELKISPGFSGGVSNLLSREILIPAEHVLY